MACHRGLSCLFLVLLLFAALSPWPGRPASAFDTTERVSVSSEGVRPVVSVTITR